MKLVLFTALALAAQTRLPIDQLKGPPGEVRLLALDAAGKLTTLTLGEGLEISGSVIKMKAVPVPSGYALIKSEDLLLIAPDGTYSASTGMSIYRNGMLMSAGSDYTMVAGRVRPAEPWSASDVITAVSYRILPLLPNSMSLP